MDNIDRLIFTKLGEAEQALKTTLGDMYDTIDPSSLQVPSWKKAQRNPFGPGAAIALPIVRNVIKEVQGGDVAPWADATRPKSERVETAMTAYGENFMGGHGTPVGKIKPKVANAGLYDTKSRVKFVRENYGDAQSYVDDEVRKATEGISPIGNYQAWKKAGDNAFDEAVSFYKKHIEPVKSKVNPKELTEKEFLKYHQTGQIQGGAYSNFDGLGFDSIKKTDFSKKLQDFKLKNGTNVELRQKAGDPNIVAFKDSKPIGMVSDEAGTDGVWVFPEYQKNGLGTELLYQFRKQFPENRKIGQMTMEGQKMTKAYYRKLQQEGGVGQAAFTNSSVISASPSRVAQPVRKALANEGIEK